MMQEQNMEKSDENIGIECKVEKHNNSQNRIRFKNSFANIGDEVIILSLLEHSNYIQQKKNNAKYLEKINQLQHEIDNTDIDALNKQIAVYEKQVDKLTKSNNSLKQWNSEFKTKENKLTSKINHLESKITTLGKAIAEKDSTIANLKTRLDEIGATNDKLTKQLSEHNIEDLQEQISFLSDELKAKEKDAEYWQKGYNDLLESSDNLTVQNESLIAENKQLRKDNNAINETNQLLNENIIGLKKTFEQTLEDNNTNAKNKELELKETIKKHQTHIDELTDKYQSLLVLKDYIPPKEHHKEILTLKDEISSKKKEISDLKADIETKLATQKSELDIAHADAVNKINLEHAENKAKLLVVYNNELNNLKLQYNNLANDYNNLIANVDSLTRINTLFNGNHNKIKGKETIKLIEITSEQLPPADEDIMEYVPKDKTND